MHTYIHTHTHSFSLSLSSRVSQSGTQNGEFSLHLWPSIRSRDYLPPDDTGGGAPSENEKAPPPPPEFSPVTIGSLARGTNSRIARCGPSLSPPPYGDPTVFLDPSCNLPSASLFSYFSSFSHRHGSSPSGTRSRFGLILSISLSLSLSPSKRRRGRRRHENCARTNPARRITRFWNIKFQTIPDTFFTRVLHLGKLYITVSHDPRAFEFSCYISELISSNYMDEICAR